MFLLLKHVYYAIAQLLCNLTNTTVYGILMVSIQVFTTLCTKPTCLSIPFPYQVKVFYTCSTIDDNLSLSHRQLVITGSPYVLFL